MQPRRSGIALFIYLCPLLFCARTLPRIQLNSLVSLGVDLRPIDQFSMITNDRRRGKQKKKRPPRAREMYISIHLFMADYLSEAFLVLLHQLAWGWRGGG